MTTNQIAYQNLQEAKRLNTLTTTEAKRHNLASEQVAFGTLGETTRHNQMTESIDISKLGETTRHNRASESIDLGKLAESRRTNRANEALRAGELGETNRHNVQMETETTRTNKANEALRAGELSESNRHNVQMESETSRHNKQTERQALANMNLDYQKLSETIQSNRNSEEIRSEANRLQSTFNDALARTNFLNWAANDSRFSVQNAVDRQRITNLQNDLQIAQQQMQLAYRKQDWDQFMSGADLALGTFRSLSKYLPK